MTDALLTLSGVHTHIGAYHILHGVDLVVPRGQLTMLLGRNGAGKTTTLRTIMGLWRASQGRIVFDGQDITQAPTPQIAGRGIAYVPENMGIFADLTVKENMLLAARGARTVAQIDAARLARNAVSEIPPMTSAPASPIATTSRAPIVLGKNRERVIGAGKSGVKWQ